jgi:hypothetical protein
LKKQQIRRGHAAPLDKNDVARVLRSLESQLKYSSSLDMLGLADTVERIKRTVTLIGRADNLNDVGANLLALYDTLARESSKRHFACLDHKKVGQLVDIKNKWSGIWEKFPSTEQLSKDGVECYVLGLNAPCIYQMMMTLEIGLKSLSKRLHVKYDRQTWRDIIKDIEDAISNFIASTGKMPKGSKPPSPRVVSRRRADANLFAEAATEFTWFREAWRNHVAHGRAKYDENDALKVMTHVHGFMERLSTRLKEMR